MRRRASRWTAGVLLVAGAVLALTAWPVVAGTVTTGTSAEAWYQASAIPADAPLCILPCPQLAVPANPYPGDTLHVGVAGGRETARTYVALDLAALPTAAPLAGGTVRLPVAGPDAGTTAADLAELVACAVRGRIEPVEAGQPDAAPEIDCGVSAALAPADDVASAFTFDLGPFAAVYPGVGDLSLAVVPAPAAVEAAATWRVVFHGRNRDSDDAQPITADVEFTETGGPDDPVPVRSSPAPAHDPPAMGPPWPITASDDVDAGASAPAAVAAPQQADGDGEPVAAVPAAAGYAYPQVWLLPLLFLVIGAGLVRSLSQPYEAVRDAASP